MIYEIIVTTLNEDGSAHIAPMGVREEDEFIVVSPFRPSTTLNNIQREQTVCMNMTDNIQIFAGCLTGRRDWQIVKTEKINGYRLDDCLTHRELEVVKFVDDEVRPQFYCKVVEEVIHKPFLGFNRAQAAVLEVAILASRLHMLSKEKVMTEIEYHKIAIDKTSGNNEIQAWGWLMDKISNYYKQQVEEQS